MKVVLRWVNPLSMPAREPSSSRSHAREQLRPGVDRRAGVDQQLGVVATARSGERRVDEQRGQAGEVRGGILTAANMAAAR
jgi:hypothetical protein